MTNNPDVLTHHRDSKDSCMELISLGSDPRTKYVILFGEDVASEDCSHGILGCVGLVRW